MHCSELARGQGRKEGAYSVGGGDRAAVIAERAGGILLLVFLLLVFVEGWGWGCCVRGELVGALVHL